MRRSLRILTLLICAVVVGMAGCEVATVMASVSRETDDELIEQSFSYALLMAQDPACRSAYQSAFGDGFDPYLELIGRHYRVRLMDFSDITVAKYKGENVGAFVECVNRDRLVFNEEMAHKDGPVTMAYIWMHELVHLADCSRHKLHEKEEQEVAQDVAMQCFRSWLVNYFDLPHPDVGPEPATLPPAHPSLFPSVPFACGSTP